MVRRLKSDAARGPGPGPPRRHAPVPAAGLEAIDVAYPDEEREAYAAPGASTPRLAAGRAGPRRGGSSRPRDFVTLLLKKRLFSSPEAFATHAAVHQESLA